MSGSPPSSAISASWSRVSVSSFSGSTASMNALKSAGSSSGASVTASVTRSKRSATPRTASESGFSWIARLRHAWAVSFSSSAQWHWAFPSHALTRSLSTRRARSKHSRASFGRSCARYTSPFPIHGSA